VSEWPTRFEGAEERIFEGVLTGEFAPGQRLKAQDLAAGWGISPTPIREALQRLAAIGFLEAIPNRGVRVAPIAAGELREVYSLRLLLEPFALRASLENRDQAWEESVRSTMAELRAVLVERPNDPIGFERAHAAFHRALLSRCESASMLRIIDLLGTHSSRYRLRSLGPRGGTGEVVAEHQGLLEACLDDDIDEAVARLFAHLKLTVDSISDDGEGERLAGLFDRAGRREHLGQPA
jgi:DNA-binding GntR family transcriptional regulator